MIKILAGNLIYFYFCSVFFHSIRFKVNKGWVTAVTLFFMPLRYIFMSL